MMLKWTTINEYGDEITHTNPELSVENAASYARKNCRRCYARGYLEFDEGWIYYNEVENGHQQIKRRPKNPRVESCSCVDRIIQRTQ